MAKAISLTLPRLREIFRRQDPPNWGSAYDPAIRATREESPYISRPATVKSELLGRECHTLSLVEQKSMLLALFNPALFEMQEQRMLPTEARPHPLASHPLAIGMELPHLRGTIDVCDRLDMIDQHLWIYVEHPEKTGRIPVPAPFIGDFLLFLIDQNGPYCVNWTIKQSSEDFGRPLIRDRPSRRAAADAEKTAARHAIEEQFYLDAHIPTIRVVDRDIPELFFENLQSLLLLQHRAAAVDGGIYAEVCDRLRASIQTGQPPLEIVLSVMHRYDLTLDVAKALFFRSIWRRDVRPELMDEPIFIDRPLKPEMRDPLQVYAHWFKRHSS